MTDDYAAMLRQTAKIYRESLAAPDTDDMFSLAYQWQDKKHRHVFDLCRNLEDAADHVETLEVEKKELKYLLGRCVAVLSQFQNRGFYQFEPTGPLTPWGLETLDMANAALKGKKKDD